MGAKTIMSEPAPTAQTAEIVGKLAKASKSALAGAERIKAEGFALRLSADKIPASVSAQMGADVEGLTLNITPEKIAEAVGSVGVSVGDLWGAIPENTEVGGVMRVKTGAYIRRTTKAHLRTYEDEN